VIKFTHACGKDNPMGYWSEPVSGPGWLDPARPVPPPKKRVGQAQPTRLYVLQNTLLCFVHMFPFQYHKIPKIFGDLSWFICEPLKLYFIFFFLLFCLFYDICLICRPLLLNVIMLCNVFFFSKKTNNKKGKQKEKKA
jgi:hypothetical protein